MRPFRAHCSWLVPQQEVADDAWCGDAQARAAPSPGEVWSAAARDTGVLAGFHDQRGPHSAPVPWRTALCPAVLQGTGTLVCFFDFLFKKKLCSVFRRRLVTHKNVLPFTTTHTHVIVPAIHRTHKVHTPSHHKVHTPSADEVLAFVSSPSQDSQVGSLVPRPAPTAPALPHPRHPSSFAAPAAHCPSLLITAPHCCSSSSVGAALGHATPSTGRSDSASASGNVGEESPADGSTPFPPPPPWPAPTKPLLKPKEPNAHRTHSKTRRRSAGGVL